MPERPRREGGGTADGMGLARQADAARDGKTGDDPAMLMDEVVRRGNVTAAFRRLGLVSFIEEHRRLARST